MLLIHPDVYPVYWDSDVFTFPIHLHNTLFEPSRTMWISRYSYTSLSNSLLYALSIFVNSNNHII
jgi:hypothetical protein